MGYNYLRPIFYLYMGKLDWQGRHCAYSYFDSDLLSGHGLVLTTKNIVQFLQNREKDYFLCRDVERFTINCLLCILNGDTREL